MAGELTIVGVDAFRRYELTIEKKVLVATDVDHPRNAADGWPIISIMAQMRRAIGGYDEILVVRQSILGNACPGGPIRVVALKVDREPTVTQPIVRCKAGDTVIVIDDTSVMFYYESVKNPVSAAESEELRRFD